MRLIALRALYNPAEYGRVPAGGEFSASDRTAAVLIRRGLARELAPEGIPPALIALRAAVEQAAADLARAKKTA